MTSGKPRYIYTLLALLLVLPMLPLAWIDPAPGGLYGRLKGLAYDAILPRPGGTLDPRVVIVDIDEASLAREGRWPWPRARVAALLAALQTAHPATIGLDILFPDPGDPEGDAALAQQLARDNVVGAVAFALGKPPPRGKGPWRDIRTAGLSPSLDPGAVALGHITPLHDADFVIRRLYPWICAGQECHATLALAMLANWSGLTPETITHWRGDRLCVGAFCLRLNADNSLSIPYPHGGRFPRVSAADVLAGNGSEDILAGAMLLVGTSAVGLGDLVATPLSANTPGVELHATLLAALLDSFQWSQLPYDAEIVTTAVVLLLLITLAWPYLTTPAKIAATAPALLLPGLAMATPLAGYWLNPLPLWGAVISAVLLCGGWEVYLVLSQRRKIYRAFAAYVPPVVLRTLVKRGLGPDQLDAQRADVTVFFADIQGFTALSEQLEPEQLVEITSHLFSEITEEIHRHRGTLDKFMGDAVMAFWGAPLPQDNHPALAVDCALAVHRRLSDMKDWLARRGYPEIRMTMGLESGTVTVGNLGARQRRAYTIMGKTVNLAAHLQQQCKAVGKSILCGPELCARLPEERILRMPPTGIRGIEGKQVIGCPVNLPDPEISSATP